MRHDQAVLVTGANGFLGRALCAALSPKMMVKAAVRRLSGSSVLSGAPVVVGDLSGTQDWSAALQGVSTVVHCAARVHVMKESVDDPLAAFREVNVSGTLNLAHQAAGAGVKRFVFISSIGVNGAGTFGRPFSERDIPAPHSPYAISKCEAESGLRELSSATGMEVVIVRPPLVYGPGVKGNFLAMMIWLDKGVPLPFGAIYNKRSFVALDNLIDLIVTCIDHPAAANETFLVSDGEDISTMQLLRRMGRALDKPARLFPVPVWMLEAGAVLIGKRDLSQRLCGSLQVDISQAKELLGWSPLMSVEEGLRKVAADFLGAARNGR